MDLNFIERTKIDMCINLFILIIIFDYSFRYYWLKWKPVKIFFFVKTRLTMTMDDHSGDYEDVDVNDHCDESTKVLKCGLSFYKTNKIFVIII